MLSLTEAKICVIGLGYVGLPLAIEFSKKYSVIGFDIDPNRINELRSGVDKNLELSGDSDVDALNSIEFETDISKLRDANVYIVTVPTPVDAYKIPDLTALQEASILTGELLDAGNIVIYESTVYPGVTEDFCVPLLSSASRLIYNEDFFVGYSPERINPGDKSRGLPDIVKVTSGSTHDVSLFVDRLYSTIISAGTHRAETIKVAEASKVIENVQRDVNIALINEFSMIFDQSSIDTAAVLDAARTKWNFMDFKPGLVGGHCIGIDPFYLIHKALEIGIAPELMMNARKINENMSKFIVKKLVNFCVQRGTPLAKARVLILGFSFKENCPDTRNTKVFDLYKEAGNFFGSVYVEDHIVSSDEVMDQFDLQLHSGQNELFDIVILAVPHQYILKEGLEKIRSRMTYNGVFFDLKSVFPKASSELRL